MFVRVQHFRIDYDTSLFLFRSVHVYVSIYCCCCCILFLKMFVWLVCSHMHRATCGKRGRARVSSHSYPIIFSIHSYLHAMWYTYTDIYLYEIRKIFRHTTRVHTYTRIYTTSRHDTAATARAEAAHQTNNIYHWDGARERESVSEDRARDQASERVRAKHQKHSHRTNNNARQTTTSALVQVTLLYDLWYGCGVCGKNKPNSVVSVQLNVVLF